MSKNIRLLPFLIVAGVMLLGVKIGGIYEQSQMLLSGVQIQHQGAIAATEEDAPTETADKAEATEGEAQPVETSSTPLADADDVDEVALLDDGDPLNFTAPELNVLQSLSERRQELDQRERELDRRLALVKAAEERIDSKVGELRTIQESVEATRTEVKELVSQFNTQKDKKFQRLVKTYESMKPKDAARIFDELEMGVLLDLARSMKERNVASILAAMDPKKAKMVTANLARQSDLPPGLDTN